MLQKLYSLRPKISIVLPPDTGTQAQSKRCYCPSDWPYCSASTSHISTLPHSYLRSSLVLCIAAGVGEGPYAHTRAARVRRGLAWPPPPCLSGTLPCPSEMSVSRSRPCMAARASGPEGALCGSRMVVEKREVHAGLPVVECGAHESRGRQRRREWRARGSRPVVEKREDGIRRPPTGEVEMVAHVGWWWRRMPAKG